MPDGTFALVSATTQRSSAQAYRRLPMWEIKSAKRDWFQPQLYADRLISQWGLRAEMKKGSILAPS